MSRTLRCVARLRRALEPPPQLTAAAVGGPHWGHSPIASAPSSLRQNTFTAASSSSSASSS
eukprot:CAMPEP_0197589858 /NCGR_PEP_ID=MMETSP1326-20131121/10657_1 /TAXON_ID=1155430 /ORGANISM="Genus nov. species nov., Strain RCC2288" /LENGTH=60 /DNA_ID=CAMNT_0043154839 /DNA_START=54 /DNA_END=233 /DNA_ORIENTATION=+